MDCLVIGRSRDIDQLFCQYRKALIALAARIVGCRCKAEDIVHDVFLKCCESGADMSARDPRQYLFGMVRNHAIDRARRASLERRYCGGSEEEGLQVSCSKYCPESSLQRQQTLCAVQDALEKLPGRTRRAFEMHRLDGIPQKQIAQLMGVSPTLVNFMVRDAQDLCQSVASATDRIISKF